MPDDTTLPHATATMRIDIQDPVAVRNWCRMFDCSEQRLKEAIRAVGTSPADVRRRIGMYADIVDLPRCIVPRGWQGSAPPSPSGFPYL